MLRVRKISIILLFTVVWLTLGAVPIQTVDAQRVKGPRTENLHILFYNNVEEAYQALKNGTVDMVGYVWEMTRGGEARWGISYRAASIVPAEEGIAVA